MINYIKKIVEKVLDTYMLPIPSFQDYVNTRYNKEGYYTINKQFLKGLYFVYDGLKFELSDQLDSFNSVIGDYRFEDLRKDDVVLDIGANVGVFSLLTSRQAKHVFAVEPLYPDLVKNHLKINGITNVTVLETGIGIGDTKRVKYGRREKIIEVRKLTEILERTGQCDFLKIDCEGCEWSITANELKLFRRIEAEIHTKKHRITEFERVLREAGFRYELEDGEFNCLIHAEKIKNVV